MRDSQRLGSDMDINDPVAGIPLKRRIAESRDRLYRVALAWCGDEMLADDLVQETMTSGIVNRRQLRDEKRLFAWLYSILNNNWRRHLRSRKVHEELDEQLAADETGPKQKLKLWPNHLSQLCFVARGGELRAHSWAHNSVFWCRIFSQSE